MVLSLDNEDGADTSELTSVENEWFQGKELTVLKMFLNDDGRVLLSLTVNNRPVHWYLKRITLY